MTIDEFFEEYKEQMADLLLYQRVARQLAERELSELLAYDKMNAAGGDEKLGWDRFLFREVNQGKNQIFGHRASTVHQRILDVSLHKNKQYLWLFVEAYELFEDFLEHAYCLSCVSDHTLWLAKAGDEVPADAKYEWFHSRLETFIGKSKRILETLRNAMPEIQLKEKRNALNVNLRGLTTFAEKMRHIIVHNSARTNDKNAFITKVFVDAGLSSSGQDELWAFMESFFFTRGYYHYLHLLEVPVGDPRLGAQCNGVDELSRFLMAYADLIREEVRRRVPRTQPNDSNERHKEVI
jgi:hypothetical protein